MDTNSASDAASSAKTCNILGVRRQPALWVRTKVEFEGAFGLLILDTPASALQS